MKASSILLFWCVLFAPVAHGQAVLKLCYEDVDNFPWHVKGGHGLSNNLVDMASTKSGVKIEQTALPWKRCLLEVARGTQVGGFGASYNDERAVFGVYPTTPDGKLDTQRRLKTDGYSVYRLRGSAVGWDGKRFTHLTGPIGAQMGYSVVADLAKMGITAQEGPTSAELNMRMLASGRIQLLALLTNEGDEQLENPLFAAKIEKISPPMSEKPYFVIINKDFYAKNRQVVEDFWDALAVARESNEFKALRLEKMKK